VIQFVLEHGQPQDHALVIGKLRGQMLQMARHKFASNVCEKALVTTDALSRRILIDEMMTPKQDGSNPIVTMMKDQFASEYLPDVFHYNFTNLFWQTTSYSAQ
jgi:pumilio RNA-binding family